MTSVRLLVADQRGAITVDWVTVTAGILAAGIMVVYAIYNNGVSSLVVNIDSQADLFVGSADPGSVESINR
jgi:hypothetical protein